MVFGVALSAVAVTVSVTALAVTALGGAVGAAAGLTAVTAVSRTVLVRRHGGQRPTKRAGRRTVPRSRPSGPAEPPAS